jgi:hypothetical protein
MNINRCIYCGSENLVFEKVDNTIYYGKLICGHCKRFCKWVGNPDSKKADSLRINQKTVKDVCDFHNIKEEQCFFCQRTRNQLGVMETLTIDHIIELDKGGEDQIFNMQVLCSACHKLKNWCRLYMNWHFNKEGKNGDTKTTTE